MRRFSDELEEDREFEIGGELFKWRYPHWTEGAEIMDQTVEPTVNGDGDVGFYTRDTKFAIDRIPNMLDPVNDSHKRFKALVARKTDPVPRQQFVQLYVWLVQKVSGLPTTPPSEPGDGQEISGTSSPAGTPQKAAT